MTDFRMSEPVVTDEAQGSLIQFLSTGRPDEPRLELIQPLGEDSPAQAQALRGGGLSHICFRVLALDGFEEWCHASRITPVREPIPAPAFGGRRVAFGFRPGLGLVEFVECEGAAALSSLSLP